MRPLLWLFFLPPRRLTLLCEEGILAKAILCISGENPGLSNRTGLDQHDSLEMHVLITGFDLRLKRSWKCSGMLFKECVQNGYAHKGCWERNWFIGWLTVEELSCSCSDLSSPSSQLSKGQSALTVYHHSFWHRWIDEPSSLFHSCLYLVEVPRLIQIEEKPKVEKSDRNLSYIWKLPS